MAWISDLTRDRMTCNLGHFETIKIDRMTNLAILIRTQIKNESIDLFFHSSIEDWMTKK